MNDADPRATDFHQVGDRALNGVVPEGALAGPDDNSAVPVAAE